MAVSHIKSDTIADFTGTFTGFNSQGSTTTIAATDIVRPSDWNSAHNQFYTLTGNTTGNSTVSGTNVIWGATDGVQLSGSSNSVWVRQAPQFYWEMPALGSTDQNLTVGAGSHFMEGFYLPYPMSFGRLQMVINFGATVTSTQSYSASVSSQTSSGGTGNYGGTWTLALWSRVSTGSNVNSSQIITFYSNTYTTSAGMTAAVSWSTNVSSCTVSVSTTQNFGFVSKIDSQGNFTTGVTSSSSTGSSSSTSTNQNSFSFDPGGAGSFVSRIYLGNNSRLVVIPFGTTLSPGEYWLGFNLTTSSGSTNYSLQRPLVGSNSAPNIRVFAIPNINAQSLVLLGSSSSFSSTTMMQMWGTMTQTSATTTTQAASDISLGSGSNQGRLWFNLLANTF